MYHKSTEEALFDELAAVLEHWKVGGVEALIDPDADLLWCDHSDDFGTIQKMFQYTQDQGAIAACMSRAFNRVNRGSKRIGIRHHESIVVWGSLRIASQAAAESCPLESARPM